jgi:hypothetical protein
MFHACGCFVVVGLGGAVAGRLFVTCRQNVARCFHLSPSSRVGWEDGSRPPLGASGCRHLTLPLLLWYPSFVVFECCWMRWPWGVGMWVSSFPLLVVVVALGRLPAGAFHRQHQELLAAFSSIVCFFALAEGCVKLALEACESLVRSLRTDNGCVFRNVPHLVGGVVSASVHLSCQV